MQCQLGHKAHFYSLYRPLNTPAIEPECRIVTSEYPLCVRTYHPGYEIDHGHANLKWNYWNNRIEDSINGIHA